MKRTQFLIILLTVLALTNLIAGRSFAQSQEELIRSYFGMTADRAGIIGQQADMLSIGGKEAEYKEYTCPKCGRSFRIQIDKDDVEFKKGLKSITCPYDGTEFFPDIETKKRPDGEKSVSVTIRSPYKGKEFVAELDIEDILSGKLLTDPYTGKSFRYKAELLESEEPLSYRLVECPKCGRTIKLKVLPGENLKQVRCPYDGETFEVSPLGRDSAQLSTIEKIFARQIPTKVSKELKQFGYDIFPEVSELKKEEQEEAQRLSAFYRPYYENMKFQQLGSASQDSAEKEVFSAMVSIPVGPDYILGPSDVIILNMWGVIQQTTPLNVDGDGKIMLPKIGPLFVWGMRFDDAEKLIREKMLEEYANIEVNISMGRLRKIQVFVLGEVKRPGAYMLSSQATVFHALYTSGGPTKVGTMRKIKLIRNNEEKIMDLYSFIIDGNKEQDYKLMANDTILVQPIGDVVGIAGNVKRPAIYEITSQIGLDQLIRFAGGANPASYLQRIQIERIQGNERKIVQDLEFSDMTDICNDTHKILLNNGDLALIFPIASIRHNFVSISGNVNRPGDYEYYEGMKTRELIAKAGGVLSETYFERAEIYRVKEDGPEEVVPINLNSLSDGDDFSNIELKEWDRLVVYSKSDAFQTSFVEIEGAVNKPGRYELSTNMRLSDLIFRGGGLKPSRSLDNAELFRIREGQHPEVKRIDLAKIIADEDSGDNLKLFDGDHLFVREDTSAISKKTISLKGEFKYPGGYVVENGERLSSVIRRAGGFTENAFLKGAVFTRESVKAVQEKVLAQFIDAEQKELLQEQASLAVGSTESQRSARMELIKFRQERLQALMAVGAPGRLIIRLDQLDMFAGSEYDIEVENGDILYVSSAPSSVQVVGNVYNPSVITFIERKGIDYYLTKVGGVTKHADKKRIYVIAADGTTRSKFVKTKEIERGDTIVVPEEIKYKTQPGLLFRDTVGIVYQITLGAIAIAALN